MKRFYDSKSIIFNVLAIITVVATFAGYTPNQELAEITSALLLALTPLINIVLRSVTDKPLIVKLSPNEDYVALTKLTKDHVDYIGCGNTVGPGLVIDIYSKRPVLAGIYGGMSGPSIKPKNMKMVNDVYDVVKDSNVKIIAYGGIETWEDIIGYAIAGASIFGLGTCLLNIYLNGRIEGKTSEEIVEFTNNLWNNVEDHLKKRKTTLDKLVGSLIR